jgi:hypothetical protein
MSCLIVEKKYKIADSLKPPLGGWGYKKGPAPNADP